MKLSNKFTLARVVFAPIFFLMYNLPVWFDSSLLAKISACAMIPLLIVFELTDYWDGHFARKNGEVSDFGKLFDPFADVMLNLTLFSCAVITGYMPMVLFILIMYREFSQSFLRMVASRGGVAVAARKGGKFKTVLYIISAFLYLAIESVDRLGLSSLLQQILSIAKVTATCMFVLCTVVSWATFIDYVHAFRSVLKGKE